MKRRKHTKTRIRVTHELKQTNNKELIADELECPTYSHTRSFFYCLGLGLLSFLVYISTLYPTVSGGDSGELITAAATLGVAHPPGYPLFLLFAHLFTWIPMGSIAWRVNLFSAVCSSISVFIFSNTLGRIFKNVWIGILVSGIFAFSALTWQYSIQAEVFSLNQLFISLLLSCFYQFSKTQNLKYAFWFSFTLGLGLSNHHTLLLMGSPLGLWMIFQEKSLLRPQNFSKLITYFVLGLLPYLYLMFAPSRFSLYSWGEITDFKSLISHFLRTEYGTFQLGVTTSGGQFINGLKYYFIHLSEQTFYIGPILLIFTLGLSLKKTKNNKIILPVFFTFLLYLVVFHSLCNIQMENPLYREVVARFWIQADILAYFIFSFGFYFLVKNLDQKLVISICILVLLFEISENYATSNQRNNYTFQKFSHSVLGTLPQDSILLSYNDTFTFPLIYFQTCEGFRKDIKIFDRELLATLWMNRKIKKWYPEIQIPGLFLKNNPHFRETEPGGYTLNQLMNLNYQKFPIFAANFVNEDMDWEVDFEGWPYGFMNKMIHKSDKITHENYPSDSETAIQSFSEKDFVSIRSGSQESFLWTEFWNNQYRWARALQLFATERKNDPKLLKKTIEVYRYLNQSAPELPTDFYYFFGDALLKFQPSTYAQIQEGVKYWEKFIEITPSSHPKVSQVIKNLREIKAQLFR